MVSGASATTITDENVRIDLENSHVNMDVTVGELTSSNFIYITNSPVSDVNASISGKPLECGTEQLALGSQIECEVNQTENFTVDMEFNLEDIVEDRESTKIFSFQQPIYRPTENYNLEVTLPRGSALKNGENSTQQVISPLEYETSSNGRRISVTWDTTPRLGETLSFYILYESFNGQTPNRNSLPDTKILLSVFGFFISILAVTMIYRRRTRENLSELYEDLSSDEIDVLDLMKDEDGEYLQKDLVNEMDYSKAKISDIVSGLVEKDIIEKSKEGRSNKLEITKKYSY